MKLIRVLISMAIVNSIFIVLPILENVKASVGWVGAAGSSYVGSATMQPKDINVTRLTNTDGSTNSLVLDSNNMPHIAWQSNMSGFLDIYYVKWNGSDWVGANGSVYNPSSTNQPYDINITRGNVQNNGYSGATLRLDKQGRPNLFFSSYGPSGAKDAMYVKWNGSNWVGAYNSPFVPNSVFSYDINVTRTTGNSNAGTMELDSNGWPCVIWHEYLGDWGGVGDNAFVRWNGSNWVGANGLPYNPENGENANVTRNDGWSANMDMHLDSLGRPHISWFDNSYGSSICYVYWNGSNWAGANSNTYDPDNGQNAFVSYSIPGDSGFPSGNTSALEIDSSGKPHLVFDHNVDDTRQITYLKWNGLDWVNINRAKFNYGANNAYVARFNLSCARDFRLDSKGYPHILFRKFSLPAVYYIYFNGSNWIGPDNLTFDPRTGANGNLSSTTINPSPFSSLTMIIDKNDSPHVLFDSNATTGGSSVQATYITKANSKTDCDWASWGKTKGHERIAEVSCGPGTDEIKRVWQYQVADTLCSSATVWSDKVYMGSESREFCLDAKTGELIWEYKTNSKTWSPPTVEDGLLYMGTSDTRVLCLNAVTGGLIWEFKTEGEVVRSPAIVNGLAYVGSLDRKMYCLYTNNGEKKWEFLAKGSIASTPSYADGLLYFQSRDNDDEEKTRTMIYCLDAGNGKEVWSYRLPDFSGTSVACSNNRVYVGCNDGLMYCLNAKTGYLNWAFKTDGPARSCPAIEEDRIYFGSDDSYLYCVSVYGNLLWKSKTGDKVYSSPAVCGGRVFVGSDDKFFYMFDKSNGAVVWKDEHKDQVWASPAIASNSIYVGSSSSIVICYSKLTQNSPICGWPMLGKTLEHTCAVLDDCAISLGNKSKLWEFKANDYVYHSSPSIWQNRVVFGSHDKNVYCVNIENGNLIWSFRTNGIIDSTPAIADGRVLIGSSDGFLYCLDFMNGSLFWKLDLKKQEEDNGNFFTNSPIVIGDRVICGSTTSQMNCIDLKTGANLWLYNTGSRIYHTPAYNNKKIYFGTENGMYYCISTDNGEVVWQKQKEGQFGTSTSTLLNNRIFCSSDTTTYCINIQDGETIWQNSNIGGWFCSPVVSNGNVYVSNENKSAEFFCLDAITGYKVWSIDNISPMHLFPAITQTHIYFGTTGGYFYCVEKKNGDILWLHNFNEQIHSSPTIAYGKICFGVGNSVVCLSNEEGEDIFSNAICSVRNYSQEIKLNKPISLLLFPCNNRSFDIQIEIRHESPYSGNLVQYTVNDLGTPDANGYRTYNNGINGFGLQFTPYNPGKYYLRYKKRNDSQWYYVDESFAIQKAPVSPTIRIVSEEQTDDPKCNKYMEFWLNSKRWTIDGSYQNDMETAPVLNNSRTFLVIRYITQAIGASIQWDPNQKVVYINYPAKRKEIYLKIGDNKAEVDGQEVQIDKNNDGVVPFIQGGRTMLPLRFISENLGLVVDWDSSANKATVNFKPPECLKPEFTLQDTDGKTYRLSDQKGKPVLIDFTASWCTWCKVATPDIDRIAQKYGNSLTIYSVDVQESLDTVRDFRDSLNATWPFLLDEQGKFTQSMNVKGYPTFVLLDKNGVCRWFMGGYSKNLFNIISDEIDKLLK